MDVAVDHAGDQRAPRRVDLVASEARKLAGRTDALDLAALLEDRLTVMHLLAVEQPAADIQRRHYLKLPLEKASHYLPAVRSPQPSGSAGASEPASALRRTISASMPAICGLYLRASSKAAAARAGSPICARSMPRPE